MKILSFEFRLPKHWVRRLLAGGISFVYGATNVVFCHAAEASFWSTRRKASKNMAQNGAPSLPTPTDALILAQLPGGARLDFQGPIESSVIPTVPAKEHLVGGKVPVFAGDLPRWLADVVAPYGNLRDVFLSNRSGAPLIIQVQDLHDSTEAQRNIAGLVEALQDERGVSLVGLEGAQGAFATEAFRSFPDADITKAVAEHFMEEGYLGGPEFAGITAKRMPLLWGVEDMDGYKANVAAVKESAKNRPAVNLFLSEARHVLDDVKDRRLSVRLLEFDKHLTGYHLRKESLGAYVRYLLKASPQSVAHVPNLVLLKDALHWEDSLDFKRIERERAGLLERMVQNLSKANLDRLVARSAMYRLGRVSYGDYYRFLRALCDESGVKLDDYTQMSAYVRYVLLAERINRNDLLTELSNLERTVQDGLVRTAEERRIVDSARHLALLERLVKHAYTPSDWVYHMAHESEILNVGVVIEALAQQTGTPHNLSPPTAESLKPFEEFCLQALGRNGAMVKNLLEKMNSENRSAAVLVAGGFHTEGLSQLLRQKDISYAVVTPKVNGTLPDGHRTLDLLARDPAPLEKLFGGETINIPTPRMANSANIEESGLAHKLATLFVVISLGLTVLATNGSFSSAGTPSVPTSMGATAVPTSGAGAKITVGKNSRGFLLHSISEGQSANGFVASLPGYGTVVVNRESKPLAGGRQLFAYVSQWKTGFENQMKAFSLGSKMGWEWFLGLLGIGSVRRVGEVQTTQAVSPTQSVTRPGDATEKPTDVSFSILSMEGQILVALETLANEISEEGVRRDIVLDKIRRHELLGNINNALRESVLVQVGQMEVDADGRLKKRGISQWVAKQRRSKQYWRSYFLQKFSTYKTLETWKGLTENRLKQFLGRHDILGTAVIEELGLSEKWTGLWEGRVPAALAGAGVGILAVLFTLTTVQWVGLAVVGSFVWSRVGPQLKFVLDHGSDQTHLQKRVRLGATFLLNFVAVSVSAAVMYLGIQFGVEGTTGVFALLSLVLGFAGAVLTHAIIEILDILPETSFQRTSNFVDDSEKPSINQDPLGKPLTGEEEIEELIKKWGGKNLAELDEELRVVADHDLGGSVNDLTNKHSVGVLGESRSVDVVSASEGFSPYWWQRFWIKEGINRVNGEIRKGPGGDDYKMIFNENNLTKGEKSIEAALTDVIDAENDVMRDQFAFYALKGPQFTNGKEEETAYLETIAKAFEREMETWGRMSIVRHGNGVTIAVKRGYPGEKLSSIENHLEELGSWRRVDTTRPGLGLFTYSMGGLRLGDVVRRLTLEYPKLELLAKDGTLRPELVPVVMMWADRLAEDMLAVAKGRGRKQVFIANELSDVYSFERPGTVTEGNIKQTLQENSGSSHDAFNVPKAEEFWKELKKEKNGHVSIFEVAQYRKQGLRWGVNSTSERALRHLPAILFRFVPERWVRSLEKRIQSRAFHSWQGSDQHGKGNNAIKAHHELVTSLNPEATKLGRAVDTFYSFSRGPPSLINLVSAADTMRKKLATQHPDEKKKIQPFHVVYDFNLEDWTGFLTENRTTGSTTPGERARPRLSLEDVASMQNAVVTYLGRRYGGEILLEKLREFFVVQPSENVFLISMDVKGDGAEERFRKMELVFRRAQEENARAAELVLNARAPIRLGSRVFSMMAKGVERGLNVSPARARQIVSGRYVQSLVVPLAELPFLPYLSVGFSLLLASVVGPWVGVIAGSFLMALIHGKPVMTRGPPESLSLQKDSLGQPIESNQTLKQFAIRFLAALSINTFAIFVGGVDPSLLFTPHTLTLDSFNFWTTGLTGYLSHSLFNFLVPESYRLSISGGKEFKPKRVQSGSFPISIDPSPKISDIASRDYLLRRLLLGYAHHFPKMASDPKLNKIADTYKAVLEFKGPSTPGVKFPLELASTIAEWGGSEETIMAAFIGGVAKEAGLDEIPADWSKTFKINETSFIQASELAAVWLKADRFPFKPKDFSFSQIRNQMGFILQGHIIQGEQDDQAFLLNVLGKALWLKHSSGVKKNDLAKELEFISAPMAEGFGQNSLASEIWDHVLLGTHPDLYADRHEEFRRITGLTHLIAQDALEDLRADLEKRLNKINSGMKVFGRVKSLGSMNEKAYRDKKKLDEFMDLFGLTVVYPEGVDRNDSGIQKILKAYGESVVSKTGLNYPQGREYEFFRTVIQANEFLSPFKEGQYIEVQVYDHDSYIKSKTGEAGHWIYNLLKRLGYQVARVDPVSISGDLKVDLAQYASDREPYVYVTVRVPRESGEWSFVPLRLSKGAIPSDALAHRRVDLFQNSYSGVGMLIPSQKPPEEWELSPLSEDFKLKPGMVLAPMPQPIGQVLNFFNITLASDILKNSTRPRTILMAELAHAKQPDRSLAMAAFSQAGRALVREKLVKLGNSLESLEARDSISSSFFTNPIAIVRRFFRHGFDKGFSSQKEQDLLFPLANRWGLAGAEEVFAYLGSLSGRPEKEVVLKSIVSQLLDFHLETRYQFNQDGSAQIEIFYRHDRPGLEQSVYKALSANGIKIIGNSQSIRDGEKNGFSFAIGGKPNPSQLGQAAFAVRQIPDIPQAGEVVNLEVSMRGADTRDLPFRIRDVLANAEISFKGYESHADSVVLQLSVSAGAEDTVKDILETSFPEYEVQVNRAPMSVNGVFHSVAGIGLALNGWGDFSLSLWGWNLGFLLLPLVVIFLWKNGVKAWVGGLSFDKKIPLRVFKYIFFGFGLFVLFTGQAFGADSVVNVLGGLGGGNWGDLLVSAQGVLGTGAIGVLAALGIRNVGGQNVFPSFSASGGTNKVNRVTFGAAMHFQSIGSGPGHVPYVSYSLRSIGDNNKIVVRRILTQQSRLEQAIKGIKVPHGINKADVLKRAKSRIKERELNAQTAVVDVLDAMGEGKDPSASAAIQLLKKEILGNLIDSHSLVFQGFSKEELSRAKDAEKIKLNGAVEKVMSLVNSRSLNLSPQEDLTPKEQETIQAVMAGVEVDKMILNDLHSRSIDKIERDSQDALGAVIRLYRETDKGIHDVDHAPAQEKEHLGQIRDALVQSRDLLLSVLFELQELVPASQIEGELLRFQQAVAEIPKGMKQTLYFQMAKRIESKIGEGRKAESAVHFVHEEFSQQVKNNPDIDTITNVFYSRLTSPQRESTGKNVVLFTKEVPTPTDLIRLQQSGVHIVGVVCAEGNRGSHASIVAASFKIPFLTGVQRAGQTVDDWNEFVVAGTLVGVVGSNGVIEVNPPDRKIAELKHLQKELVVMEQVYEKERQAPCPVRILASPDSLDEIDSNEVGLFRTEYLFADSDRKPLIDGKPNPEFEEYLKGIFSNAASALSGKGLNIRIIDNQGSDDKPLSGVPQDADGAKGIHFILRDPLGREIAKQEIRAILQVYSTHPNIRVFFPLVSTPEDADEIDRLMKEVVSDLFAEKGIEFSLPPVGYMVETPAGVSNVKMLASRAAFFSIGSTDLTRAVFSLQRNDKFLDSYLSSVRPELVRSLEKVLVAASNERRGMDVALCGALASSRVFWPVAIILNEIYPMSLSVPPPMIPETKAFLRRISQEKEALNKIRSLLYSHQPDAAKITAESAKLIEKVDQNLKNERPYVEAMRRLDESEKAKLLLAVVVVIGVSSLLAMASFFPAMADAATLLSAGGSGDSGLEVFAQLFQGIGLATSIGPIVKKPTLPKRIDAFLNGLSSANSASEIFQSGIELMNSCGESGEDIKSVRNAILEKGLVNIIGEKSNTIGVKKLQRIIEIRMVLADVKKQLALWNKQRASQGFNIQNADSELATLAESWKSAPRYGGPGILNKEVQREFAPIHLMGITLLRGAIEANDPTIQKNIMGKVDSAIRGLSLVDFKSRLGTFNKEVVDLNPLIELGQSAHAQNQRVLQAVVTSALFGTDLFTPLVVAASEAIKANTFLKGILSKLGIEWNGKPIGAGRSAIKLLDDKTGLFKLTLKEILGVVIAAGYAVQDESAHQNSLNKVLKDIRLHAATRIPFFIDRVKILRSSEAVPQEMNENEFAFHVRDSRNFLTIFIHEKTLDAWKEKGDAFYYSAVMVMLYHEWAESFGVSHDHLVKMGLTIDGLDSLFMSGASEKDIYWEIKARGMLALTMRVPDERIINVQARTDAESVLDTLIPPGLPQGVENYVTGQAYPINADRSTYYHRVTHDLRRSLPGLADDDYNDSIRGTPDSNYETRLDSVLKQMGVNQHETASALFELLVKERTAFFSDEGKDFTIKKDGQTSLREGKKFQADLARDILSRVFQVLRSKDLDLTVSRLFMIKAELYVLHRLGGSLFLSFSHLNDADRLLSPAQRRVYQERDLAWLDQMIFVNDRGFSPVNDKQKAIANTSLSYQTLGKVGNQMVGAFAALDDSLLEESITPVIRISNDLLNTGVPLTGPQRTALREVFALARRAEVDIAVAKRVVFLLDASEGETQTTESLLAALAKRMGIDSEALISLSSARLTGSEGLFTDNTENKRTIRTFSAKALFERLSSLKISSTKVDIYSVPPTDSLAEVWDVADLDSKAGLVLRLIELWSSDVARRISSESDAYKKQLDAIKQSA